MKKAIFLLLVICTATFAQAQKLKDLLYSGKLKKDSTSVLRKTDDLSAKIDTTSKKVEVQKQTTSPQVITTSNTSKTIEDKPATTVKASNNETVNETATTAPVNAVVATPAAPVKSNTKIWKEYTESLIADLKDVLASRKVKKETYYFLVEYELGTDGTVNVLNVTTSPENDYLLGFVKQKISDYPPKLNPILNSANQPQKVKRRQNFFITKE